MSVKYVKLANVMIDIVQIWVIFPLEFVGRGSDTQLQVGKNQVI